MVPSVTPSCSKTKGLVQPTPTILQYFDIFLQSLEKKHRPTCPGMFMGMVPRTGTKKGAFWLSLFVVPIHDTQLISSLSILHDTRYLLGCPWRSELNPKIDFDDNDAITSIRPIPFNYRMKFQVGMKGFINFNINLTKTFTICQGVRQDVGSLESLWCEMEMPHMSPVHGWSINHPFVPSIPSSLMYV